MKSVSHPASALRRRSGFSLVEMIGVLAIIAILAVIIVPKVFSTIASSRVTNAAASTNAVKSAVTDYYSKFGTIPVTTGNANARLDDVLVAQGLLDGRFTVKLGTPPSTAAGATYNTTTNVWAGGASQATQSRVICSMSTPGVAPSTAAGANFYLRTGTTASLPAAARVVSAVIMNCTGAEARELSLRVDGDALSAANTTVVDNAGRVVYAAPNATTGLTTAYVYLVHQ